jgi:aspartate aminotransferase-like enzyme
VLVTCTHASNILGTIHDIKAIADAVHKVPGALLCVDAVAYAPHRQIDVEALGVDFYSFSWYKVSFLTPFVGMTYGTRFMDHISRFYMHQITAFKLRSLLATTLTARELCKTSLASPVLAMSSQLPFLLSSSILGQMPQSHGLKLRSMKQSCKAQSWST